MTRPTESIGIAAVLVQAKDESARAFYLARAEWLEFSAGGWTLWLPVGVVVGAKGQKAYGLLRMRPAQERLRGQKGSVASLFLINF